MRFRFYSYFVQMIFCFCIFLVGCVLKDIEMYLLSNYCRMQIKVEKAFSDDTFLVLDIISHTLFVVQTRFAVEPLLTSGEFKLKNLTRLIERMEANILLFVSLWSFMGKKKIKTRLRTMTKVICNTFAAPAFIFVYLYTHQ